MTAPLYRPIRRLLPDFGGIDFSPLVILILIQVIKKLLAGVVDPILFRRMTAKLIDGKAARRWRSASASRAKSRAFATRPGRAPGLAVVLVGEHPPSAAYVRSKVKATLEAGHGELRARAARDGSARTS